MKTIKRKIGKTILNTIIDNLLIPLHIPGMCYCGPGSKLDNGTQPVNKLDDIVESTIYSTLKILLRRQEINLIYV